MLNGKIYIVCREKIFNKCFFMFMLYYEAFVLGSISFCAWLCEENYFKTNFFSFLC